MQKTYVIGHRNPDTDSVCAPYCYAWFKRIAEPEGSFIPGVLGTLNPQTRFVFEHLGIEPPALLRDVYPKGEDVMLTRLYTVQEDDPVGEVTKLMNERNIRTVPVTDRAGNYRGLISMHEVAHYFMPHGYESRPVYSLLPRNFAKVIPGKFLREGAEGELSLPVMVGAMGFETFIQRLERSMVGQHTLPLLIVGNRPDIIEYAVNRDFPVIILTGMSDVDCCRLDLSSFHGWIYVSEADTAETIRLLGMSIPARTIANCDLPVICAKDTLDAIKKRLMNLDHHGLAVLEGGKLIGLVTSSRLIDPPRHRVIMVDHNEPAQSVEGIEFADVVEIIDHHRLDTLRSSRPIYVYADPLGSSCTLVYKLIRGRGVDIAKDIAALLLSGILSDTIILRSPTTTREDISAANILAEIAGLDLQQWGKEIFRHAASLSATDPNDAVTRDFKIYKEEGYRVGIAQIEVITLRDLPEVKLAFLEALDRLKEKYALDWALLLATDIIAGDSVLLSTSFRLAGRLIYHKMDDRSFHLPDVLSRKKQLLPEVISALREE